MINGLGGNWYVTEDKTRTLSTRRNVFLTIFSGTIDILQLPFVETSGAETLRSVYLDDGSKQIPTPKFFFKVVLDGKNKQGVVFIGELEIQEFILTKPQLTSF